MQTTFTPAEPRWDVPPTHGGSDPFEYMAARRLDSALADGRLPTALQHPPIAGLIERMRTTPVVYVALPIADIQARGIPTVREAEALHALGIILRHWTGYRLSDAGKTYLAMRGTVHPAA